MRTEKLLELVPDTLPVTRQWLLARDPNLDRHAMDNLVKSGQLTSVAHGVYMRPGATPTWEGVVCSLQHVLKTDLTPGGLTALELKGLGHYLALSRKTTVRLYGKDPLPRWVDGVAADVDFIRHTPLADLGGLGLVDDAYDTGLKKLYSGDALPRSKGRDVWTLTRSSPERACLELLTDVPNRISFEHADQLMQGLTTLSPRRLEQLLRQTKNVKVRRLFYWLAERHHFAWFKRLPPPTALDALGLGSGKRMLAHGGKLDTKYMITVPEDMWTQAPNTTDKTGPCLGCRA